MWLALKGLTLGGEEGVKCVPYIVLLTVGEGGWLGEMTDLCPYVQETQIGLLSPWQDMDLCVSHTQTTMLQGFAC